MEVNFAPKGAVVDETPAQDGAEGLARMLREGRVATFNARVAASGPADLTDANLRMADLRGANLQGASLKGAYLRAADLRGQDLSTCDLAGASMSGAKVSGVLFPDDVRAEEIMMSVNLGTRLRVRRP